MHLSTSITRREFLKISGLISANFFLPQFFVRSAPSSQNTEVPNLLVFVFDAFSAYHLSLYGYPRQSTPNIDRLANEAIVYHNHSAGGNFTKTGTASLPWTHPAMVLGKTVAKILKRKVFSTRSHLIPFPGYFCHPHG